MADSRRIVRRFYVYSVTNAYGFYLPVYVLYLQEHKGFGLAVVGLVGAAFQFAMLGAEIPTGYLGDRIGRRASLALGNALGALTMLGFVVADSVAGFVGLYVVWAFGWAFKSGTGNAWLYELLERHGEESEYARVRGRANTVTLLTSAVTAIAGSLLVTVNWNLPFLANAALVALGIPVLLSLPAVGTETVDSESNDAESEDVENDEVESNDTESNDVDDEVFSVRDAAQMLRIQAGRPAVRWLVVYVALFYALFAVTKTFEQPALRAVGVPIPALGVLYAGFKVVSAGAASMAGWLEERFGVRGVFALLAPVMGLAFASVAVVPAMIIPVVFLNRNVRMVTKPIRNQYLNDRLGDAGRATVLSGVSMVLAVAAGTARLVGGWLAARMDLLTFLAWTGVVLAGAAGLLWLVSSPVRPPADDEPDSAEAEATVGTD